MLTNCVIPLQLTAPSLAPSGGEVMNTDDEEVNLTAWRQLYQAAVLGLDPTKIQDRIEEAEKAIAKRALAVMREGADGAEREALANAMQALSDLKRHLFDSFSRIRRTASTVPTSLWILRSGLINKSSTLEASLISRGSG